MSTPGKQRDPWRWPAFALWLAFLSVGFAPDEVFSVLRECAAVPTQRALINHPFAITVAFASYLALFTLYKAQEAGLPKPEARGRAVQIGVLAAAAFLPWVIEPLLVFLHSGIALASARWVIYFYFAASAKFACWIYLFSLVFRCYVLQNYGVFAGIVSVFPSSYREASATLQNEPRVRQEHTGSQ